MIQFLVNGAIVESEIIDVAIQTAFTALGTTDGEIVIPADLETIRAWALGEVKRQVTISENQIDDIIANNPARITFLSTEIVDFFNAGQPTNPAPGRYVIANAIATRRGDTLYDTLISLLAKWFNVRDRIADIMAELDRLVEEIENASTKLEIGTILATMDFG